jgi:murein DD-endopeptidase MepM/ murein hydrolase activator NlpD
MITVIEHQKVKPRKAPSSRPPASRSLDFSSFPGALGRAQHVELGSRRPSWRNVQNRTPRRPESRQRKKEAVSRVSIHRIGGRKRPLAHRAETDPRSESLEPSAPRLAGARAAGLAGVFRNLSRIDLLLASAALLAVLMLLGFRLSSLSVSRPDIGLPDIADAEGSLIHYLIPEEQQAIDQAVQHSEIIDLVRTTSYTVRRGDTISAIAQRFSLNMDTVISFNGIQDARALRVGSVLSLPNANGLKYKVRRGDFLGSIARKYGVDLNALLDWNGLETSVIVPGQELFLPGARLSEMELNRVFGRLFIYPTRGRITDRFGMRQDPFTGMRRFHNGVDMAAPVGTPVVAAMSGKVSMLGYNATFGKYIILTHPEGFQTLYGHLDAFRVKKGESVKQGQLIADMGNSGYSTGSHLHFSIFHRGEPIDPFKYLH